MSEKNIKELIKTIETLSLQLSGLQNTYSHTYKAYEGDEFENQNTYAAAIENQITTLTHEASAELQFGVLHLKMLVKYFNFRKTYKEYTNTELLKLIDIKVLTTVERAAILKTKKDKNSTQLVAVWNKTFNNMGYQKLKDKLAL